MTPIAPQGFDVANPGSAANRDTVTLSPPFSGVTSSLAGGTGSGAPGYVSGEGAYIFTAVGCASPPTAFYAPASGGLLIPADQGVPYEAFFDVNLITAAGLFTGATCQIKTSDGVTTLASAVTAGLGRQTVKVTATPTDNNGITLAITRAGGATGDLSINTFSAMCRRAA